MSRLKFSHPPHHVVLGASNPAPSRKPVDVPAPKVFAARLVDHTGNGTLSDGSTLWEVVTPDGERIASCTGDTAAGTLAYALNEALAKWIDFDPSDRVV